MYSYLLFLFAPNTEKHLQISSKESTSIPLKRVRNAYWPEDDSVRSGRAVAEKRTCPSTDKNQLKNSWSTFFFPQNLPQLCCYGVLSSGPPPTPIPLHLPVLPTDFLSCDVLWLGDYPFLPGQALWVLLSIPSTLLKFSTTHPHAPSPERNPAKYNLILLHFLCFFSFLFFKPWLSWVYIDLL